MFLMDKLPKESTAVSDEQLGKIHYDDILLTKRIYLYYNRRPK